MAFMIEAKAISYVLSTKYLVKATSMRFKECEMSVIMGPNGAGKSTLLKLLAGAIKPTSGTVFFKQKELNSYSVKELAKERAVLSQSYSLNFPTKVADVIWMGRYPFFENVPSSSDFLVFEACVDALQLHSLLERDYNTLSGGEAQKVQMARVMAQVWPSKEASAKALFLDEPVSSLDLKFQHEILSRAKKIALEGNTVVAILHDVNLALQYADCIHFMRNAELVYSFYKGQELDIAMLNQVFAVHFEINTTPLGGSFLTTNQAGY
jgi:iron complex transport system ATP-binding protein